MKLRLAAVLALAMGTLLHADDSAPAMPPDIAAIIAKMKAGGMPSADDLAKLKAWQQGITSRIPVATVGKPAPDSIPCRIHVTLEARSDSSNAHWTVGLNGDADADLAATLGGDGDYYLNQLDPSKPASTFLFTPKPNASLRGGLSYRGWDKGSSGAIEATLSKTRFGVMLTTTGHDDLFAGGTGFGADENGTQTERTSIVNTEPFHDDDLRNAGVPVPFVMENRATLTTGKPTPKPAMKLSYKALADAIKSGQTRTITGTESFSFADGVAQIVGTSTISITLRPKPLELDVEPDDKATFPEWVPIPDKRDVGHPEIFGDPKPLVVHVALRNRQHGPADVKSVLTISLDSVSKLPGIAMNYPPRADANDKPDLFFVPQAQQPAGIQVIDETHVKTTGPVLEAKVKVAARDTGAYGKIIAKAEDVGIMSSVDPATGEDGLRIPKDNNHNRIADHWEKDWSNTEARSDVEDTPAMYSRGDAYTLFDEYRGFIVDDDGSGEKHVRFSPRDRDLIVLPRGADAKLYRIGAQAYAKTTGVKVHFVHEGRTAPWPGSQQARWANFNETPDSEHASAVIIADVDGTPAEGDAGLTHFIGDNYARHAPDTVDHINVSRAANTHQVDGYYGIMQNPNYQDVVDTIRRLHLDRAAVLKAIPNNRKNLIEEMIEFTTMHELGHATGGLHHSLLEAKGAPNDFAAMTIESHGDVYCPMRYWQFGPIEEWISFMAGTWIPLNAPYAGGAWKFCTAPDADGPNLRLRP